MRTGSCAPAVRHPAIPKGGQRSSIRPSDLAVCTFSPGTQAGALQDPSAATDKGCNWEMLGCGEQSCCYWGSYL